MVVPLIDAIRHSDRLCDPLLLLSFTDRFPMLLCFAPVLLAWSTARRDESVTPSNLMPLAAGKIDDSSRSTICAISAALATGAGRVLLLVICVKSDHFTFSVTVLPRMLPASQ